MVAGNGVLLSGGPPWSAPPTDMCSVTNIGWSLKIHGTNGSVESGVAVDVVWPSTPMTILFGSQCSQNSCQLSVMSNGAWSALSKNGECSADPANLFATSMMSISPAPGQPALWTSVPTNQNVGRRPAPLGILMRARILPEQIANLPIVIKLALVYSNGWY